VPSGSYLALSDVALDLEADARVKASADNLNQEMRRTRQNLRSLEQLTGFFSGLEMVEPGFVQLPRWRPDPSQDDPARDVTLSAYCGIGQKP